MTNKRHVVEELYQRALIENLLQVARWTNRDHLFGNLRLAAATAFVLVLLGSIFGSWWSLYWLLLPFTTFVFLAFAHNRVADNRYTAECVVKLYKRSLSRLNHTWHGGGVTGTAFLGAAPLYGADIDIFGQGSLFELLCNARTTTGQSLLADRLSTLPSLEEVRQRQGSIRTLSEDLSFRERLSTCGKSLTRPIDTSGLARWSESAAVPAAKSQIAIASALICLFVVGLVVMAVYRNYDIATTAALLSLLFQRFSARRILLASSYVAKRESDMIAILQLCRAVARIEPKGDVRLEHIRSTLDGAIEPIERLRILIAFRQITNNQIGIIIGSIFQAPFFSGAAIERWHANHRGIVTVWTDAIADFEVLTDLATFAYENPEYAYPDVVENTVRFEADDLAHPLLPLTAVGNSLSLNEETRLLVLSGSNMSGKSTLMRAMGVNLVLAMTGAPVRARKCSVSIMAPAVSIRTQDSLHDGVSRFYAEITRLSKIAELSGSTPCLFLLDEILSGTNSFARQIGAQSIVSKLLKNGSIGIISTHDLALEHIADMVPGSKNVHLDDQVVDGKLSFDYILKPGFVTTSNAVELMRAVGLDIT